MEKIKFSVIVPIYNTKTYLPNCLDSLILQDYKNIEFICIDDGSTDGSLEICKNYQEKDDRFIILTKKNGGPASTRNLGIKKATGDYISFVDSDDTIKLGAYSKLAQLIEHNSNPDVVIFGANLLPDNGPKWLSELISPQNKFIKDFTDKDFFNEIGTKPFLWMQLLKRSIIVDNKLSLDESLLLGEDQLFQFELFRYIKTALFISDKLYCYRWYRNNSLMNVYANDFYKKIDTHINIIDKVFSNAFCDMSNEDKKILTFNWSIDFIYYDILNFLVKEQCDLANKLFDIYNKYNCAKYYDKLDILERLRYDLMSTMVSSKDSLDQAIVEYDNKIKELDEKISTLEAKLKSSNIFVKIYRNYKKLGFWGLIKKIISKVTQKG